jgi:hypothetical protein
MANNDRNDRNERRGSSGNGTKRKPWHLFLVTKEEDRDGKLKEGYEQCGTLWQMNEREGFSWTQHLAIPAGSRLLVLPPKDGNGGGDRG